MMLKVSLVLPLLNALVQGLDSDPCVCIPEPMCRPNNCFPLPDNPCYTYRFVHSNCPKPDEKCCARDPEPRRRRDAPVCGITDAGLGREVPKWTVVIEDAENKEICSASLISPSIALTTAHCVSNKVRVATYLKTMSGSRRNFTRTVAHKDYKARDNVNDIGVIILSKPFDDEDIEVLCLPDHDYRKENCAVSGWKIPPKEQSVKPSFYTTLGKILPTKECNEAAEKYKIELPFGIMCVGGDSFLSGCTGSSGGPLACSPKGPLDARVLAGIQIFGARNRNCDEKGSAEFYVDVKEYLPWINKVIEDNK